MKIIVAALGVALAATAFAAQVSADGHSKVNADCSVGKPGDEVSYREAHDVYTCLGDKLYNGYNTGDKRWIPADFVRDYRNWEPASTLPANPGFHSERFLYSYVNSTGAAEYKKFAEGNTMPVGTVIAKESFNIDAKGKAKPGPLFLMQKVAAGTSPKTNDWYYMAVAASGTPMAVNVYKACNECHKGFADSDYLGYPVEEVRRTN